MNDYSARLSQCFLNVFPGLGPDEVTRASTASLALWDSVAHVTLLSAVSEEFGVDFEMQDFEELISFELILARLGELKG